MRFSFAVVACLGLGVLTVAAWHTVVRPATAFDRVIEANADRMIVDGRQTFRFDTFGDEAFWGDALQLHKAIAGERNGGIGPGVSPKTALSVGLKVDLDAIPAALQEQLKAGQVNLDDPATTLALLKLNAVVGVTGFFNADGTIKSIGIQCAFCHSNVDDVFAPGIGHRRDGWANRDLNVGAIVSLSPNLRPFTDLLGVDVATVKKVFASWGPGRFDAELDKDGRAFRPDGKQAGTLIPPAFGLAGVNLHTWTGFGSVTHWNAYVCATEMHCSGTVFHARLPHRAAGGPLVPPSGRLLSCRPCRYTDRRGQPLQHVARVGTDRGRKTGPLRVFKGTVTWPRAFAYLIVGGGMPAAAAADAIRKS